MRKFIKLTLLLLLLSSTTFILEASRGGERLTHATYFLEQRAYVQIYEGYPEQVGNSQNEC